MRFRRYGATNRAGGAPKQRSLFGEILDWMLAPLLLLWPTSVVLTWLVAQGIANQPFDRELGATVRVLSKEVRAEPAGVAFRLPAAAVDLLKADAADRVVYQVLGAHGEWLSGDRLLPAPHDDEGGAAGTLRFRDDTLDGVAVRVAYLWVDDWPSDGASVAAGGGAPLVQVAQTLGSRKRFASEIIKGVILPQFVVLPLAVLLVWLALARGIAPLNALQQRIRQRDSSDLSPIDERQAPEEVTPLVLAINDLLARLDQSMRTQKRFLANAAHQLKTPLAGLRTQAEFAQRQLDASALAVQCGAVASANDAAAEQCARSAAQRALGKTLQQIALGSQSAAHVVNQLLSMARAEDRQPSARRTAVDLVTIATEAVQDFVPHALDKRIDLGFEGPDAAGAAQRPHANRVRGHALLLRELIRNLVDNALHYTPAGGTVTVRVIDDPFGQVVVLQVEDSGLGIAPRERELVFQPFYRGLGTGVDGSGLGLAIVREIATQHGATVTIDDASGRRAAPGTLITVRLPAAAPETLDRAE